MHAHSVRHGGSSVRVAWHGPALLHSRVSRQRIRRATHASGTPCLSRAGAGDGAGVLLSETPKTSRGFEAGLATMGRIGATRAARCSGRKSTSEGATGRDHSRHPSLLLLRGLKRDAQYGGGRGGCPAGVSGGSQWRPAQRRTRSRTVQVGEAGTGRPAMPQRVPRLQVVSATPARRLHQRAMTNSRSASRLR